MAELRGHVDKQTRELELLEGRHGKLQGQYHQLTQYNDQLGEEMEQRNRELKLKEEELASVKQESNKVRGFVSCVSVTQVAVGGTGERQATEASDNQRGRKV